MKENFNKSNKYLKGQSAMEYLMTYGWAILILLLLTGFLINMNLKPSLPGGDVCDLGPNLGCNAQSYSQNGNGYLLFSVVNSFGYKVNITSVNVTDLTSGENMQGQIVEDGSSKTGVVSPGNSLVYVLKFPGHDYALDQITKYKVVLKYYSCSAEINPTCNPNKVEQHSISGDIMIKATEAPNSSGPSSTNSVSQTSNK